MQFKSILETSFKSFLQHGARLLAAIIIVSPFGGLITAVMFWVIAMVCGGLIGLGFRAESDRDLRNKFHWIFLLLWCAAFVVSMLYSPF